MRRVRVRRAALMAALLVAGCRGDSQQDQTEAPPVGVRAPTSPICESILPAELTSLTGRTFKPGEVKVQQEDMYRCEWEPESDDRGLIQLTVYPNAETAQEQHTSQPGMTPLEDIGDAAWWSDAVQTLAVRSGERLIVVSFGSQDGNHSAQGQQIVRRALERL